MPRKPAQKKIEAAIAELDKVRATWLRRPNVTAVDVGFKISEGEITDQLAVRAHVERKLPIEALERHELLTESGDPEKLGDFPIDVIEAVYEPALQMEVALDAEAVDRFARVDPLVGGVSCGNPRETAGTVGAIVFDRTDCKPCILSNWHVLAGSRTAAVGEPIFQPGVADGGTAADTCANLRRFRLDNDMDAALAVLDGSRGHSRDILGLNPVVGVDEPALGMQVVKSGRTTGLTEGIIDGVSLSTTINYRNGVVQAFSNQVHIVPRPPWPAVPDEISSGGDSGSVWIDESSNKAVGLHFAGETDPAPSAENAIANRMPVVASELNFSFVPLFCDRRPRIPREDLIRILCRHFPFLCRRLPNFGGQEAALAAGSGGATLFGGWCPTPHPWPWPDPDPIPWPGPGPDPGPLAALSDSRLERLVEEILAAVERG